MRVFPNTPPIFSFLNSFHFDVTLCITKYHLNEVYVISKLKIWIVILFPMKDNSLFSNMIFFLVWCSHLNIVKAIGYIWITDNQYSLMKRILIILELTFTSAIRSLFWFSANLKTTSASNFLLEANMAV